MTPAELIAHVSHAHVQSAGDLNRRLSALSGARAVATYERNECPGACPASAARALLADVAVYIETLEGC